MAPSGNYATRRLQRFYCIHRTIGESKLMKLTTAFWRDFVGWQENPQPLEPCASYWRRYCLRGECLINSIFSIAVKPTIPPLCIVRPNGILMTVPYKQNSLDSR